MAKSCAAQVIGPAAALLLHVVALQEDAKRYTGPVTFFTGQLLAILGLRKWDQLDRIRKPAIEAGWLHYESTGKRLAGRYWVTIPAWCQDLGDSPVDENPGEYATITPSIAPADGCNGGFSQGSQRVEEGEPPTHIPFPENTPLPPQGGNAVKTKPKKKMKESAEEKLARIRQELLFPPELSCERCRKAMDDWLGYKGKRRNFYLSTDGPNRLLVRWARHGRGAFCDAVDEAISKNWEGLLEPDKRYSGRSRQVLGQKEHDSPAIRNAPAESSDNCPTNVRREQAASPEPVDKWAEVESSLAACGIVLAREARESAESHGCTHAIVAQHIEHYRSKPGAWAPAILQHRVATMNPALAVDAGWPVESAEYLGRKRIAEQKLQAQAEQVVSRKPDSDALRIAVATFEAMSRSDQEEIRGRAVARNHTMARIMRNSPNGKLALQACANELLLAAEAVR